MSRRVGLIICVLVLAIATGVVLAEETQHEHPDEVDEEGDTAMVQVWLADRLGGMYAGCASALTEWDSEICDPVGTEGEVLVERYQDIERETTPAAERRADEFETARTLQDELASSVAGLEPAYVAYETAQATGDENQMREQVAELRTLADDINDTATYVNESFQALDNATTADLETAADQALVTAENATAIMRDVELLAFEEADMTVTADPVASFRQPATVTGTVRSADNEPVTDAEVTIVDDTGQRSTATTDVDGQFEAQYRPVETELGETTLVVRYEPGSEDPYPETAETMTVHVRQTPTQVTVTEATTETAFDDEVTVEGRVTAAGAYPSNTSVRVSAGGTVIATNQTDVDGSFTATGTLPENVSSGTAVLAVEVSEVTRALATARKTQTIGVFETEMELTARSEENDEGIFIRGELSTEPPQSTPVGGQVVTVAAGEETWTATTDEAGVFELNIASPGDHEELVVSYEDPDTNLANTSVVLPNPEDTGLVIGILETVWDAGIAVTERATALDGSTLAGGVFVTIGVLLAILFAWRRSLPTPLDAGISNSSIPTTLFAWRGLLSPSLDASIARDTEGMYVTRPERMPTSHTGAPSVARPESATIHDVDETTLLHAARGELDDSPARAVQMAYAAVRIEFAVADTRTHWEAYRELAPTLTDSQRDALRNVTETFERATFTSRGIDRVLAAEAVSSAERCLSGTDT